MARGGRTTAHREKDGGRSYRQRQGSGTIILENGWAARCLMTMRFIIIAVNRDIQFETV